MLWQQRMQRISSVLVRQSAEVLAIGAGPSLARLYAWQVRHLKIIQSRTGGLKPFRNLNPQGVR
jgi:hypothetical protein